MELFFQKRNNLLENEDGIATLRCQPPYKGKYIPVFLLHHTCKFGNYCALSASIFSDNKIHVSGCFQYSFSGFSLNFNCFERIYNLLQRFFSCVEPFCPFFDIFPLNQLLSVCFGKGRKLLPLFGKFTFQILCDLCGKLVQVLRFNLTV